MLVRGCQECRKTITGQYVVILGCHPTGSFCIRDPYKSLIFCPSVRQKFAFIHTHFCESKILDIVNVLNAIQYPIHRDIVLLPQQKPRK